MKTRHDWIRNLEVESPAVASLGMLKSLKDEPYWDSSQKLALNKAAFNFAGSKPHNEFLGRTFEGLAAGQVSEAELRKYVTDLSGRGTYGALAELSAYGALLRHGVPFRTQVPVSGADILNPNGSDIDGEIAGSVLFDVKACGLQEQLIQLLVERLNRDLAPEYVAAEMSWNVPVSLLDSLLGSAGYQALRKELIDNRNANRGGIEFALRSPERVRMSEVMLDPLGLAANNADYAFRYAKQFAKLKPFILVFVLHPWLGGFTLSTNFGGYADRFMAEFSKRTFNDFLTDTANQHFGETRADASKMLSGLLFIDAWQGTDPPTRDTMRLYLNPHGLRPVPDATLNLLRAKIPQLHVEVASR